MFLAFSIIIELVLFIAVVSSSYEAYTAKLLESRDLLLKIKTSWKNALVTSFYMFLITLIRHHLSCILFVYHSLHLGSRFMVTLVLWSYHYVNLISYLYVAALWTLSMVVSVLEEGFMGLKLLEELQS